MSTSFVQFQRCSLCRINHRKRDKHIYSKCHRDKINVILTKYGQKARMAKKTLVNPQVRDTVFEMGKQFWCYFCEEEVALHCHMPEATLLFSGIATHLASFSHKEKTEVFWGLHRIDKSKKEQFVLEEDEVKKFEALSESCIQKYLADTKHKRQMQAKQLGQQDNVRRRMVHNMQQFHMSGASSFSLQQAPERQQSSLIPSQAIRTVGASARGLSVVKLKNYDPIIGNVHLGSLPPWLRGDPEQADECQKVIGPTMEDFEKHLERQRKARLPVERVGAKFEHKEATDDNWLPSFGRVWNKNRRLHSKQQFMNEWSKQGSFVSNQSPSSTPGGPVAVHGYFRKPKTETISSPSDKASSQEVLDHDSNIYKPPNDSESQESTNYSSPVWPNHAYSHYPDNNLYTGEGFPRTQGNSSFQMQKLDFHGQSGSELGYQAHWPGNYIPDRTYRDNQSFNSNYKRTSECQYGQQTVSDGGSRNHSNTIGVEGQVSHQGWYRNKRAAEPSNPTQFQRIKISKNFL